MRTLLIITLLFLTSYRSFDGVTIYPNRQCTDLVKRYYKAKYDFGIYHTIKRTKKLNNGSNFFAAADFIRNSDKRVWKVVQNEDSLQHGDIVVWDRNCCPPDGHVALYDKDGYVVQQNSYYTRVRLRDFQAGLHLIDSVAYHVKDVVYDSIDWELEKSFKEIGINY